jgi:hypothetical protein
MHVHFRGSVAAPAFRAGEGRSLAGTVTVGTEVEASTRAASAGQHASAPPPPGPVRRGAPVTVIVLAIGLAVTVALSWLAWVVHGNNEDRLLRRRAGEATNLFQSLESSIGTPLFAASELARFNGGNPDQFEQLISGYVGGLFTSAALWQRTEDGFVRAAVVRTPSRLAQDTERMQAFLAKAHGAEGLQAVDLLEHDRVGFAVRGSVAESPWVAYAELQLPENRVFPQASDVFEGAEYAVYVGSSEDTDELVLASTRDLPLSGRKASVGVSFGDTDLIFVMASREQLGGSLSGWLPWIVIALGVSLTAGATGLTRRLGNRRRLAEDLADENQRLYGEQRSIAVTLQQALLPGELPRFDEMDVAARYLPGVAGVDIGGDWYDVLRVDGHRAVVAVGDVSGRGLHAATVMASLRFAIRAFATHGDDPATILTKVAELVSVGRDGHFATVLCGLIDTETQTMALASAGHLPPLLLDGSGASYVDVPNGVPIGVPAVTPYQQVTIARPPHATLLAFTDGLIERRGEDLDAGLERLRVLARDSQGPLDTLLESLVHGLTPDGSNDDIALLGIRWRE